MNADVIDAIADRVHQAWMAERIRQGTPDHLYRDTCAVGCFFPRDQHHPDMRPYADLAESTKEYDRVTARAALAGIEAAGYQIVKDG